MTSTPSFSAGENIAIKIPAARFARTVEFYRDVLGLPVLRESPESVVLVFGDKRLWLDRIEHFREAEVWFELLTDDAEGARKLLLERGLARADEVEPLKGDGRGFWVSSPCDIVHLVRER